MTLLDVITDGSEEINLATANRGFADLYTYRQKVARQNALGEYEPQTERWNVNWAASDDNERGAVHATMMRLARKAAKWAGGDWRDGRVWREVQTPSEQQRRYAMVKDLWIPDLDPEHYGPNKGNLPAVIEVVREGAWRLLQPGTWRAAVASTTIYDYNLSGTENWLTVAPGGGTSENPGDANALVKFTVDFASSYDYDEHNQITIAKRSAETESELDNFVPHFLPANGSVGGGGIGLDADANVPGGYRMSITNSSGSEITTYATWNLGANYPDYQGDHLLIIPVQCVGSGDYCHVQISHGDPSGAAVLPEVYVPSGFNGIYQKIMAARISIPAHGFLPPGISNSSTYQIKVQLRVPDGSEIRIRNWWMVPADEGIFELRNIGIDSAGFMRYAIVDGDLRQCYYLSPVSTIVQQPPEPNGRFLTAEHNRYTRFYFFKSYEDTSTGTAVDAVANVVPGTYDVAIDIVPRVKALAT